MNSESGISRISERSVIDLTSVAKICRMIVGITSCLPMGKAGNYC